MKHLASFENDPLKKGDIVFAGFRVVLAVILLWKGISFFADQSGLVEVIAQSGDWWFAPAAWAHYVIMAHIFGGVSLLFGMATRLAAIMQLPILGVAVFFFHIPQLSAGTALMAEASLAIFTLVLVMFYSVRGAGCFSFDYSNAIDEDHYHHHGHPSH